ncbi:MAG: DUF4192 domain-containing protein [Actinomycetes bacterium]
MHPTTQSPASPATPTIRLRGPADVVDAVPYLVGFHPGRSLVLIGLDRDAARVVLTARADLPLPSEGIERLLSSLVRILARHRVARVIAVVYPGPSHGAGAVAGAVAGAGIESGPAAARWVVPALLGSLVTHGLELVDVLWVAAGRYGSYGPSWSCEPGGSGGSCGARSHGLAGCEVAGPPSAGPPPGHLLHDLQARQIVRRVAMSQGAARQVADGALDAGDPGTVRSTARRLAMVRHAVDAPAGAGPLGVAQSCEVLLALEDLHVRDRAMGLLDGPRGERAGRLWEELTRRVAGPLVARPACLVASWHLAHGGGALVRIALDRAQAADPAYPLLRLFEEALARGIGPDAWRRLVASAQKDLDRSGVPAMTGHWQSA